ncbi:hypothetical protein MALL_0038 [Mycoplasmopsis alligatoris A21JP2]|uniref:Uncharacterized protein n=2 Tax=Mycoplasmopsis alligatoris TaxID=47687 RepID=D4XW17_9BACT|nr:hypothetical protein MALL_0038 [Mycoplasmopsis alligatoris A21JP2]
MIIKKQRLKNLKNALNFALVFFKKTESAFIDIHDLFELLKKIPRPILVESFYYHIEKEFIIKNKLLVKSFFYFFAYEMLKYENSHKRSFKIFSYNPYSDQDHWKCNKLKREYYNKFIDELSKLDAEWHYNLFLMDFLKILR